MPDLDREQRKIVRLIRRKARRYGVRPALLAAQIGQESGYRMGLVSPAGAQDVAQFMPETAKQYGVTLGDNRASDDIDGAARMMRDMLRKYGGDERKALAAYNAGPGNVDKYGGVPPFAETQNYVKTILTRAGNSRPGGEPQVRSQRRGPSYETIPGVDRSAQRTLLKQAYFANSHDPNALLELKASLDQAQDTPSRRVRISRAGPVTRGPGKRGDGVGGDLLEMFYNGPGGVNVKNGKRVSKGFVGGHEDHVHVAGGPKSVVSLGRLAQRMGLSVRENEAFDPVDPVHTKGSYHYRNQAIDVSGDPRKMARFSKRVARLYGL